MSRADVFLASHAAFYGPAMSPGGMFQKVGVPIHHHCVGATKFLGLRSARAMVAVRMADQNDLMSWNLKSQASRRLL